jgi:hypothetical protein
MLRPSDFSAGKERLEARRARKKARLQRGLAQQQSHARAQLELRLSLGQEGTSAEEWFASLDAMERDSQAQGGISFLNSQDSFDGGSLLCAASQIRDPVYIAGLVERKADVNLHFPLQHAVQCDNDIGVRALLAAGAQPINGAGADNALTIACRQASERLVGVLLEGELNTEYCLCDRMWAEWHAAFASDGNELENTCNKFFFMGGVEAMARYGRIVERTYALLGDETSAAYQSLHSDILAWLKLESISVLLPGASSGASRGDADALSSCSSSSSLSGRGDLDADAVAGVWYRPLLAIAGYLATPTNVVGFKAFLAMRVYPQERVMLAERDRKENKPRRGVLLSSPSDEDGAGDKDEGKEAAFFQSPGTPLGQEEEVDVCYSLVTGEARELRRLLEACVPSQSLEATAVRMLAAASAPVWGDDLGVDGGQAQDQTPPANSEQLL